MTYPECSRYACEECPRAGTCPEREAEPQSELERRLRLIEERLRILEDFVNGMERALAAAVRAYEDKGDY